MTDTAGTASMRALFAPLAVLITGAFMVMFDSTAMNLIVPLLVREYGGSYPVVQWVITGYVLAESAIIPLTGWLCDRFGTKRILLLAIGTFTLGSLLCLLAQGIDQLIASRVIQGLGGGMVVPIMFAYTYRISPPDRVGKIMAVVVIPILLAPALGPVVSGLIVDHASWSWIFAVNLPIGATAIALGILKLPELERLPVVRLDLLGMLLAPIAFAGICYGISEGAADWGAARTVTSLSVGLVFLLAFVVSQLRRPDPLLELRVFGSRAFTGNILIAWIAVFVQFGSLFLVPQSLQNARGFSAFEAGLIMLPYVVFAGISNQIGGRLYDKWGIKSVALTGFAILSVGMFLMSTVTDRTSVWTIGIYMVVIGASVGFCVVPLNMNLLKLSPQHLTGRVSSLSSSVQQVVVALAISLLANLIASRQGYYVQAGDPAAAAWTPTFRDVFVVLAVLSLIGFALSATMRRQEVPRQ
ncbi:DHA2 family efflux MFS transporter permease subunit [Cohnella caldifontis]|uniref:DHA2 family efflux MFS transporter permease subunit n=1 Tax=Cohnella caldifontis TaxID=3027471 RepID=UPI0023ECF591|nr:DHA2 family efflux MFS transporter permease subunit [Cohnella sp. YIM B05605]